MIYAVAQVVCIIWLFVNSDMRQFDTVQLVVVAVAAIIGIWAVISMRPGNINIVPALKYNHRLVTSGIYRHIRHPMYASVILFCAALLSSNPGWINGLVFGILLLVLWLKLRYEERLLCERYPEYRDYQQRTKLLVPFIY
jgi:protein-S-isoprenylcysteine O-methyltransferase Ste14